MENVLVFKVIGKRKICRNKINEQVEMAPLLHKCKIYVCRKISNVLGVKNFKELTLWVKINHHYSVR